VGTEGEYRLPTDPAELMIVLRELRRVSVLLKQFADLSAESVDVPTERTIGIRMAAAVVTGPLIRGAAVALAQATRTQVAEDRR
jgi:hypothetical protein